MKPLSRWRFLTTSAAAAAGGLLALRCGGGGGGGGGTQPTGKPTLGPVKRGGTYHLGTTVAAMTIDPHTEVTMGIAFVPFIYGYLLHEIQQEEGGAPLIAYDHAEQLERPDDLTYIFKLHPGIHFQDLPPVNGRELVADDVIYSFKRIAGGDSTAFWKTGIAEMTAPDPRTFSVRITDPYAYVMGEFGDVHTAIVPHEAVEEWGDLKHNGLGSGPFQVRSLSQTEGIVMDRNPNYFVEGIPYLDALSWRIIADDSSLQAAFRAKQLDVYGPPTKPQAESVAAISDHVLVSKDPSLAITMINLNEIKAPILQDERVREAMDIALDRDAIIKKLCFGEGNYTGPVSWGLPFWSLPQDEMRQRLARDLPKARQLLEAAGATGLSLSIKCRSDGADVAAMAKAQMAEAGINLNIETLELGTWVNALFHQDFELMVGSGLPYADEHLPIQFNHTLNWTRKADPVQLPDPPIDAELDQVLVTVDPYERQKLVLDVTRKILDRHGPFLYLYAPYGYTARWDYLRGYEDVPAAMIAYTYGMWLDK